MNRKVTVVGGAGNVGATVARGVAEFHSQSERAKATILGFILGPTSARNLLRPTPDRAPTRPPAARNNGG